MRFNLTISSDPLSNEPQLERKDMKYRLVFAFAPLLFAVACATADPIDTSSAEPVIVIDMQPNLRFAPTPQTISVGDTVEFRNVSSFGHTVSTRPSTPEETASTALPAGAESFDSGNIPAGGVYKKTFTVPGTYTYFCDPHHGAGMIGTIIVKAG